MVSPHGIRTEYLEGKNVVKKIISITGIIVGSFIVLSGIAPSIIGAILEVQMESQIASTVGVIGGADGPTAVMVSGVIGTGNVVLEIVLGILLVVAGIWGLRKCKNNGK